MDIGARIIELRNEKNITQAELGVLISTTQQAISNYEKNKPVPGIPILEKICDVLGLSLAQFFDVGDSLKLLPPHLKDFVTKKENHGLLKLIKTMADNGYSSELIEEWIATLDSALSHIKNKYSVPISDKVVWAPEMLLHESSDEEYTEEERRKLASGLHKKLHDPDFDPGWNKKTKK